MPQERVHGLDRSTRADLLSAPKKLEILHVLTHDLPKAIPSYGAGLEHCQNEFERQRYEAKHGASAMDSLMRLEAAARSTIWTSLFPAGCSEYNFDRGGYCVETASTAQMGRVLLYGWLDADDLRAGHTPGGNDFGLAIKPFVPVCANTPTLFAAMSEAAAESVDVHALTQYPHDDLRLQVFYRLERASITPIYKRGPCVVEAEMIAWRLVELTEDSLMTPLTDLYFPNGEL